DRTLDVPQKPASGAQVVVGLRVIGLEHNRALEFCNRIPEQPFGAEKKPKVKVCLWRLRIQTGSFAKLFYGRVCICFLLERGAKHYAGVGIFLLQCNRLPEGFYCCIDLPSLL